MSVLFGRDDGKEKVLMDVVADENVLTLTDGGVPTLTELAELINTAPGAFTLAGAAPALVNTAAGAGASAAPELVNTGAGAGAVTVAPEFGDTGAGAVAVALVVGGAVVVAVAVALALLEVAPGMNVV